LFESPERIIVATRLDLNSPEQIEPGDLLLLIGGDNDQWSPPIVSKVVEENHVVISLGEGQPGPFFLTSPVTVTRGAKE
jgi:hypothetical protein